MPGDRLVVRAQICQAAGLPSGTIHPILARFEALGWLESRWEDVVPQDEGRPRRRYYRLTEDGAERIRIALAKATTSVSTLGAACPPCWRSCMKTISNLTLARARVLDRARARAHKRARARARVLAYQCTGDSDHGLALARAHERAYALAYGMSDPNVKIGPTQT